MSLVAAYVAVRVCVWGGGGTVGRLKFECAFSTRSSPALMCSSVAQNAFVPRAKAVRLQHNKRVRLLFGRWFKTPRERKKLGKNVSVKLHSVKDGPEKWTETRQKWKNARRLPYICCAVLQMSGNLLAFFHLCLVSVFLSGPSLTEMKFFRTFFLSIRNHMPMMTCPSSEYPSC